jgi:hypothetical protein
MRNRFPPPTSLKRLENYLQEEWYRIPSGTVQNLYESIPKRTAAILKAKGGPNNVNKEVCTVYMTICYSQNPKAHTASCY